MSASVNRIRKTWIRLTQWEFWPFSVLYFPVHFYYLWLSIRTRSFFFFTSSNPGIEFGGMLGERKSDIYRLIPQKYLPKYLLVQPGDLESAVAFAEATGYPVITKPDVGERGRLVEKVNSREALEEYVLKCPVAFLLQEYVTFPVELGVFYLRFPGAETGRISSIVQKSFLQVTGNGKDTVRALLLTNPRALLQVDLDHPRFRRILDDVPQPREQVEVEPIGNHCRGTTFLDQTARADGKLTAAFDRIADQISGFHFGRFDLRCQSIEDLKLLQNFKIMELNGAGAEPGHIYQPGYSLRKGYGAIFWHLRVLAQISRENRRRGHVYWSFRKGIGKLKMIRTYNKLIRSVK